MNEDTFCIREDIEERSNKRVVKDLLCLAYAYAVKPKISELFVCSGCEEGYGNQLGHDCVMLTMEHKIERHFNEALASVDINVVEQIWYEFIPQSSARLFDDIMCIEDYHVDTKTKYIKKIKSYVNRLYS